MLLYGSDHLHARQHEHEDRIACGNDRAECVDGANGEPRAQEGGDRSGWRYPLEPSVWLDAACAIAGTCNVMTGELTKMISEPAEKERM